MLKLLSETRNFLDKIVVHHKQILGEQFLVKPLPISEIIGAIMNIVLIN